MTKDWLVGWYGHPFDIQVEEIRIPVPSSLLGKTANEWTGQICRNGNQSMLHIYLKAVARNWLESTSEHPASIRYEVTCYSPDDERLQGRRYLNCNGAVIDLAQPKALDAGERFPCYYGYIVCVDVWSKDISVEVGATHPFNLLTPLIDGLVTRAVWLPFPKNTTPKSFCPATFITEDVRAYVMMSK